MKVATYDTRGFRLASLFYFQILFCYIEGFVGLFGFGFFNENFYRECLLVNLCSQFYIKMKEIMSWEAKECRLHILDINLNTPVCVYIYLYMDMIFN